MTRARGKQYPNAPQSLRQLGTLLELPQYQHLTATIGGEDSVFAGVVGHPGRECLLFLSRRMTKYLVTLKEAYADATFVPAPLRPAAAQVYQIVGLARHNVIPVALIVMPDKEYLTYQGMLHDLRQLVPQFRPRKMHMDYERNPIRAWIEEYQVQVRGCYFHYVKAILKKVRKLGLTDFLQNNHRARSLVRSFLAIPLLPHEMMHLGFYVLVVRAEYLGVLDVLLSFLNYFMDTWMRGFRYETLSVFNQENRTNNASEAAQRTLRNETGPHRPNIWQFINAVRRYEWAAYISSRRARRGLNVGRRQKVSTLRNDMVIKNCTQDLLAGNITLKHFLRVTSTRVMGVFHESLRLRGLV